LSSIAVHAVCAKHQVAFIYASVLTEDLDPIFVGLNVLDFLVGKNIGLELFRQLIVERLDKLCTMKRRRYTAVAKNLS
jgi:hypothetical protein